MDKQVLICSGTATDVGGGLDILDWLHGLGLGDEALWTHFAVFRRVADDRLILHVTELALNDDGNPYLDYACNDLVSAPRIIELPEGAKLPAALGEPPFVALGTSWIGE